MILYIFGLFLLSISQLLIGWMLRDFRKRIEALERQAAEVCSEVYWSVQDHGKRLKTLDGKEEGE